ncbi:MAG: hypothetical protein FWF73_05305 [Spirochaetes bacterium]|nr:hypothetical protein [Spirochaetota bacterium]
MYRTTVSLLIIFITASLFAADARIERWNHRIDRLKKLQSDSVSEKIDKNIIKEITENGIKSSEEFLNILDKYIKEDGSLKCETKKYTAGEIEKKVTDISMPAISLYYMYDIYKVTINLIEKERITNHIIQYAKKRFGEYTKIPLNDINLMAEQYIFEKAAAEFQSASNEAVSEILSKSANELSKTDYTSNDIDVNKIIQRNIENSLSAKKFFENAPFNEAYLTVVPQWKFIEEKFSNIEERNRALLSFAYTQNPSLKNNERVNDLSTVEKALFNDVKDRICIMLENTNPSNGVQGNNPLYEIPDLKKLKTSIDEIDKYRKTVMQNIHGSEDKNFTEKIINNNRGIASKEINRIETQFKNEETRIDKLKKTKGEIIIYNEEMFKISRNHFIEIRDSIYQYAELSSEFLKAAGSSGKNDPKKYVELHQYKTDRYIRYISFFEQLTAGVIGLSESGSEKLLSVYKGVIPKILTFCKNLFKPETISIEEREVLNKEHLKDYAAINANYRSAGSPLILAIRKNYDEAVSGFSRSTAQRRESSIASESKIGQDETDRLFNFAKKCSDTIAAMNYTEEALKRYRDEYLKISEELKNGVKDETLFNNDNGATFSGRIERFNYELIERETATRELIAKEGMEALSGAVTLVQHYKRKGSPVDFVPSNEEITAMKAIFVRSPEIIVSSWRMNGKNFKQIDTNVTTELKKMQNKNAWDNKKENITQEEFTVEDKEKIKVTFTPPAGWNKVSNNDNHNDLCFESPDMKALIKITSISEENNKLQDIAGVWPKNKGFTMTEKNWGKKDNCDYIKSTAKNRYNRIMESYMIAKNGHIIIFSGETSGDMYKHLTKTLDNLFMNINIR